MNRRPILSNGTALIGLLVGMLAAALLSLGIVAAHLNPPDGDIRLLFLFMVGSGSASIAAIYVLYRVGVLEWFTSLRWGMMANIALLVVLIFINVWLTAQLMFISQHDYVLTIALLIYGGLVSAFCVYFIANVWIKRIRVLGQAAKTLAAGDLKSRLPVRGNDELAQLTTAFNQMVDGLEAIEAQKQQLEQARRDLVAWVSHDLRAPLATVRAMNESILDGMVTDPQTVTRYLRSVQSELFHLSKMIDDLFALAQMDAGSFTLQREPTSLRDLISDTLGSLSAQASQRGVTLTGDLEPGLDVIEVAPDKIQRVLNNLLENALRHTPQGGQVSIHACRTPEGIDVRVHNTGSVIPDADLPHVFESFYRGEPSRTQTGGARGTGLGLAIVRGFIEAHGGHITVESSASAGTTFRFTLPPRP
ncbi:MAG: HAMP domain-containing sensor histidine kinase [Anaerolineae bacterium]